MKKIFLLVCLFLPVSGSFAQLISVRVEYGFSFYFSPGSRVYSLAYNAPPQPLEGYENLFTLSYRENAFILTARGDNQATRGHLPWGLAAYHPGVNPIPVSYNPERPANRLGFIPMNAFPQIAGRDYRVAIPPFETAPPVPEPESWTLAGALALGAIACLGRFKK